MIQKLFATHVLVEDLDISPEESAELTAITQAMIQKHSAEMCLDSRIVAENAIPLFTEENLKTFPLLEKVRNYFVEGFWKLAQSYETNVFTKETINEMVSNYTGRLPIMKTGDFKTAHCHPGASAFGILYLTDVNNEKDGGQLQLHDPSNSCNVGYTNQQKVAIETKKHRLVIGPANVWHSVTTYNGEDDRIAIVFNLDVAPMERFYVNEAPDSFVNS